MIIAIDGPSGSGKSTIAKFLSQKLNISYLDTGAMYRGIGYWVVNNGISPNDEQSVIKLAEKIKMDITNDNGIQQVIINNVNVTPFIRENSISMAASTVSKIPAIRLKLVSLQREIASKNNCVLDGRDIGSYVLPNAEYKFYLTASSTVRAIRRQKELELKGENIPLEILQREIEQRDEQDMSRAFAPLKICNDAIVIDTTNLTIDEVISTVLRYINENTVN